MGSRFKWSKGKATAATPPKTTPTSKYRKRNDIISSLAESYLLHHRTLPPHLPSTSAASAPTTSTPSTLLSGSRDPKKSRYKWEIKADPVPSSRPTTQRPKWKSPRAALSPYKLNRSTGSSRAPRRSKDFQVSRDGLRLRKRPSFATPPSVLRSRYRMSRVSSASVAPSPVAHRVIALGSSAKKRASARLRTNRKWVKAGALRVEKRGCLFFHRYGRCPRHNKGCPFVHDPAQVVVCTRFLQGRCSGEESCRFSHTIQRHRMPLCRWFDESGFCSRGDKCPYLHVKHPAGTRLCRGFQLGQCELGSKCVERHEYSSSNRRLLWRRKQPVAEKPRRRERKEERVVASAEEPLLDGSLIPTPAPASPGVGVDGVWCCRDVIPLDEDDVFAGLGDIVSLQ